jgi:hypothetical protein
LHFVFFPKIDTIKSGITRLKFICPLLSGNSPAVHLNQQLPLMCPGFCSPSPFCLGRTQQKSTFTLELFYYGNIYEAVFRNVGNLFPELRSKVRSTTIRLGHVLLRWWRKRPRTVESAIAEFRHEYVHTWRWCFYWIRCFHNGQTSLYCLLSKHEKCFNRLPRPLLLPVPSD